MMGGISPALSLAKQALDYRAKRQDIIASNIANVDTPFYRPRDINFEDMLTQKAEAIYGNKKPKLKLAQTNSAHIPFGAPDYTKTKLFFRDGHMAKNDGNSVDLDVETTEMAKNSTMFNALISSIKKGARIYESVIEASSKT